METAGICEEGAVPFHKVVETSEIRHAFFTGLEGEMVRVCEDDVTIECRELVGCEAFHRAARSDWHKHGSMYDMMR